MYKKMNLLLIAAALLGASACGGLSPSGNSATGGGGGQGEPQPHTVSITGNGKITLTPDLVHISIGVQTENEAATQAVAENTAKSQGVIDALISFEIAEEDIRTTNFSVYPRQNRPLNGEPAQTTFIVQNIVSVTVRNLDALGEILDAAVKAGAN
ncbi:MAG: SIMPL domain-containing protein, partial [Anaerolineae bacterium]|nr:SIMPL domain-containing protein [Anaerolineae bacterium]